MRITRVAKVLGFLVLVFVTTLCTASTLTPSNKMTERDAVTLYGEVNADSAAKVINQLHQIADMDTDKPILMFIDSPGGSVFEGTKIIDAMLASPRPVYTIDVGLAASMAAWIEEFGVKRYIQPHAMLMFHNAGTSFSDQKLNIIQSQMNMLESMIFDMNNNVAKRTGISLQTIKDREANEWWVLSKDALDEHLVDGIVLLQDYPVPSPAPQIIDGIHK